MRLANSIAPHVVVICRVCTLLVLVLYGARTAFAQPSLKLPFPANETWVVTRGYNIPPTHINSNAFALDFSLPGCDAYGRPILAAASGTVTILPSNGDWCGSGSYGLRVVINHNNGFESTYAHLASIAPGLSDGDYVCQGQQIGTCGNSGDSCGTACTAHPGTHLHFVLKHNGNAYLPEPMSGYTGFIEDSWYTSDNYFSSCDTTSFGGTVTIGTTGTPLIGATVHWGSFTAPSLPPNGAFWFNNVQCETLQLWATHPDYGTSTPFYHNPCGSSAPLCECPGGDCSGVAGGSSLFEPGDTVKVFNTGGIGLRAWTDPCSNGYIVKPDGAIGTVIAGGNCCDGFFRWKIQWADDGSQRWSAEGDPNTGEYWLQEIVQPTDPPPTVLIVQPQTGTVVTTSSVLVTGNALDPPGGTSGIESVQVKVNSGPWLYADGATYWFRFVDLSLGQNTVSARSRDYAGNYSPVAQVTVQYNLPQPLEVTPAGGFSASGYQGGPFTPQTKTYYIANNSGSTVSWNLQHNAAWLYPNGVNGLMGDGATVSQTLAINSEAATLRPGTYTTTVTINDITHATSFTRNVTLTVNPGSSPPQCLPVESQKLVDQKLSGWEFGHEIAMSGDRLIVAARSSSGGTASIYHLDHFTEVWIEEAQLTGSDTVAGDSFGGSVAIDGTVAVVGAPEKTTNGLEMAGAAYVFQRTGSDWIEIAKLEPLGTNSNQRFGCSAAIKADRILIGAYGDNDNGTWAGTVYSYGRVNDIWTQHSKLFPSDAVPGIAFGFSLATDADRVIVGVIGEHDEANYAAYVFQWNGSNWVQEAKLVSPDVLPGDGFGNRVAIGGEWAVIGANGSDDNGFASGSAYVFKRNGSQWAQHSKLLPTDGATGDSFGIAVAATPSQILVGADFHNHQQTPQGAAYLYRLMGDEWIEEVELRASDAGIFDFPKFGSSVSLDGSRYFVGAPGNDSVATDAGAVYVFDAGQAPEVLQQPVDTIVVVDDAATVWAAVAGSDTPTYQWRKDGITLANGGSISGADGPVLLINPVQVDNAGEYDVVVSDKCGTVTSTSATLTVIVPCIGDMVASATFQPPGDGQVDAADLAYLLGEWGRNPGSLADIVTSATFQPPPDGVVDAADLAFLLGAWGLCE